MLKSPWTNESKIEKIIYDYLDNNYDKQTFDIYLFLNLINKIFVIQKLEWGNQILSVFWSKKSLASQNVDPKSHRSRKKKGVLIQNGTALLYNSINLRFHFARLLGECGEESGSECDGDWRKRFRHIYKTKWNGDYYH